MAVSDLILRQAFIEYDRRDTDQLLQHYYTDQDGNYKLSSKTHKTIMKYADKIGEHPVSEKQGQPSRFGGRRALRTAFLVAVIAALLAITIFAIGRYTSIFDNLNIHTFSKGSEVTYNDTTEQGYLKVRYSYIPSGYKVVEIEEDDLSSDILFMNESGYKITSSTIENDASIEIYNTEGTEIREVTIDGKQAMYIQANNANILSWISGEYHTTLLGDNVPINELIKMAETASASVLCSLMTALKTMLVVCDGQ